MKKFLNILGWIAAVVVGLFLATAFVQLAPDWLLKKPVPISTPIVSVPLIDTNNVRIRQWKHYYSDDSIRHVSLDRRKFYYQTVVNLFIDGGFSKEKAEIYAEIPSIESNWSSNVTSKTGAEGLWQFMPSTAASYGVKKTQLHDPTISTDIAIAHIRELDSLHQGDVAKVLFSYNGGIGLVTKLLLDTKTTNVWLVYFPTRETQDYAPKVLGCYLAMKEVK